MSDIKLILLGFFLLIIYVTISNMSYNDEMAEERTYINLICNKYHPNYNNLSINCKEQ